MTRTELRQLTRDLLGTPLPTVVGASAGDDTAATATSGVVNDNNALTWTAVTAGADGNDITIPLRDPGANDQALSVTVNGTTILVDLATDGNGAITTTATLLIAAIAADDDAAALVTADDTGASDGTGAVVAEDVLLSGGANASNTAINRYLNHALQEHGNNVGGHASTGTIALATDVRLYDPPTGFRGESDVRYVATASDERPLTKIVRLSDRPTDYRTLTGEPTRYYPEADQIGVYPIPSSTEDGKTVRVDGWYEPDDMTTDSDAPPFRRAEHRAIAILAAALVCEAQSRAEAQSSNSDISADTVQQDARTRMYAFRGKELRDLYGAELRRVKGVRLG